jgi:hypothetical protein
MQLKLWVCVDSLLRLSCVLMLDVDSPFSKGYPHVVKSSRQVVTD